jgi:AraC-like DNA-binding protein
MDFIDSYVADGNDNYIWLKAMLKQYKRLTSSVVFSLAVSGGRGSAIGASDYFKTLESGDLKVSTEERKSADDALFYLSRFVDTATYLGGRKDKLYSAIMFMYLLDGELTFFHGGECFSAGAGDLLLIPPNLPYHYTHARAESISYLWAHFTGRDAEKILRELSLALFPAVLHAPDATRISRRFEGILDAYARADAFRDFELSALLFRLLVTAARAVSGETAGSLRASLSYIAEHYAEELSVGELARMENLSPSRYHALFKAQMGLAPVRYILRLRMASAKDLLTATDLSVKEIGVACGYRDAHFFSKAFKKETGTSPSDFRLGKT